MRTKTEPIKKSELGRTRHPGDQDRGPTSRFDLDALRQVKQAQGLDGLGGAAAAVMDLFDEALVQTPELEDDTGAEPELAEAESLRLGQRFVRFFSKSVDFQVNGTRIRGKNGFQVRGGAIALGGGAALDLGPARLTGERNGALQGARGDGAQLYLATSTALTRQTVDSVYVNSDQHIEATGTAPASLRLPGGQLALGPAAIKQAGGTSQPEITFDNSTLQSERGEKKSLSGTACLAGGALLQNGASLETVLRELDKAVLTPAKKATLAPVEKAPALVSAELSAAPMAEIEPVYPKEMIPGNLVMLQSKEYNEINQQGTGVFTLGGSLTTTGDYGMTFARVEGSSKELSYTLDDEGRISAEFTTLELEPLNQDGTEDYRIAFVNARLENDAFSVDKVQVEKATDEKLITGSHDGNSPLESLLNFTIPQMPQRVEFSNFKATGNALSASFDSIMAGLYAVEDVGGIFSASIDLAKKSFCISVKKEEDLAEKSLFETEKSIPVAVVPLLPGLTFSVSIGASSNIGGTFGLSGDLPESGKISVKGNGAFALHAALEMNADLGAGVPGIAELYVGLGGNLETNIGASLDVGLTMNRDAATHKFKAEELTLGGGFGANLKGALSSHGGLKILLWKAELFNYTFKEWELLNLALQAQFSKDMTQKFNKGWRVEDSSFTLEAFGSSLRAAKLDIAAIEKKQLAAIQLTNDFKGLKANLGEIVSRYTALQENIKEYAGKNMAIDVEAVKAQVQSLQGLQTTLEKLAKESASESITLQVQFSELAAAEAKRQQKNAAPLEKHRDRLRYIGTAMDLLEADPGLSYESALKTAQQLTEAGISAHALAQLNVYGTLHHHETTQRDAYAGKAGQAKHNKRLAWLESVKADPTLTEEERSRILLAGPQTTDKNVANMALLDTLRSQLEESEKRRMGQLTSTHGFQSSPFYDKAFDTKSAMERMDLRLQYEMTRYGDFNNQEITGQLEHLVSRQADLLQIQKESQKIRAALQPLNGLAPGKFDEGASQIVFQNLSKLAEVGVNLKETADRFDFIQEAAQSRATQQQYILEALSKGHSTKREQ